jgi:hypothetical protein
VAQITFHARGLHALWVGMTESHPQPAEQPETLPIPHAGNPTPPGSAHGPGHSETASLVLLINTVLGGLGTLYLTTKSAAVTLASGLLVLLIVIVKRRSGREARRGRRGDRSGQ